MIKVAKVYGDKIRVQENERNFFNILPTKSGCYAERKIFNNKKYSKIGVILDN